MDRMTLCAPAAPLHPHGPALTEGHEATAEAAATTRAADGQSCSPAVLVRQLPQAICSSDIARVSPNTCVSSQISWKQTCSRGARVFCRLSAVLPL